MRELPSKSERTNYLFLFLSNKPKEYLKQYNICKCNSCGGTGIITSKTPYLTSWDGMTYCDECDGTGYKGVVKGLQVTHQHYLCRSCDGVGCENCNRKGIVNWISHAMGR